MRPPFILISSIRVGTRDRLLESGTYDVFDLFRLTRTRSIIRTGNLMYKVDLEAQNNIKCNCLEILNPPFMSKK